MADIYKHDSSVKYLCSFDYNSRSLEPAKFLVIPKYTKLFWQVGQYLTSLNHIMRPVSVFIVFDEGECTHTDKVLFEN